MGKSISFQAILTASLIATAAIGLVSNSPSSQAATKLSRCTGPTAKKVIDCCEKIVRVRKPYWMVSTGATCASSVVCISGGKKGKAKDSAAANIQSVKQMVKVKDPCFIQEKQKDIQSKPSPEQRQNRNPTRQ